VIKFPGFTKLYSEGRDDKDDEKEQKLPDLEVGEVLDITEMLPEQHFTEPPPRYSEASLVKKLEELGIGRPSTYAAILSVLQDRNYVKLEKKRFIAEMRGHVVNSFLTTYFEHYVEYDYTAELENELDEISSGEREWKGMLKEFWVDFSAKTEESMELKNSDVLSKLDGLLEPFIFDQEAEGDPRKCPACSDGKMHLKLGKFGAFLGCTNYPDCKHTRQLDGDVADEPVTGEANNEPRLLGEDPDSGMEVLLKKGPYGWYVQLGEEKKPKRTSLPKNMSAETIELDSALSLLSLPREVGEHPETGKKISAGLGRYGPYLLHDGAYTSLTAEDDVLTVGMNRAVTLIAEKAAKKGKDARKSATPLRIIGQHPDKGDDIAVYDGRYGPYIKYNKKNFTLPKKTDPETFSLEEALQLIQK
jgi:DNA topoisomerase-1